MYPSPRICLDLVPLSSFLSKRVNSDPNTPSDLGTLQMQ
ncbi:hypothetical protein PVAG01_03697 [Phlyctema vagabunda]|uniref:Uncharacterized protein n=1 Tax=Phlyctema vagabunda TaxID=108571 RepID=A0ABR4PNA8_9HELO